MPQSWNNIINYLSWFYCICGHILLSWLFFFKLSCCLVELNPCTSHSSDGRTVGLYNVNLMCKQTNHTSQSLENIIWTHHTLHLDVKWLINESGEYWCFRRESLPEFCICFPGISDPSSCHFESEQLQMLQNE